MTQTKTEFWSWQKVEAGHYVLTTDTRYTATVGKESYGNYWWAEAASPSGKVRTSDGSQDWRTMKDAKAWALKQIDVLVQQDETELLANSLGASVRLRGHSKRASGVTMSGPGDQTASFTVEGDHHTYKVTVERWNG